MNNEDDKKKGREKPFPPAQEAEEHGEPEQSPKHQNHLSSGTGQVSGTTLDIF